MLGALQLFEFSDTLREVKTIQAKHPSTSTSVKLPLEVLNEVFELRFSCWSSHTSLTCRNCLHGITAIGTLTTIACNVYAPATFLPPACTTSPESTPPSDALPLEIYVSFQRVTSCNLCFFPVRHISKSVSGIYVLYDL